MNVKQFKRRFINGLVEPELFYMPVKKKENSIDYFYLSFKELLYSNYYDMLKEYPEYTDKILKLNKYQTSLKASYSSEAIFFDKYYKPLFKMQVNNNLIKIQHIPYGIYHIRIIKGAGYTLNEYTIEINKDSNKKTFILELFRSYLKIEFGMEDGENPSTIYENNIYRESNTQSPWTLDHCLSCNASGRMYYKYYTYDNKYLGKVVLGHCIYDTDFLDMGNITSSYYYFKYYPINIIEEHITGNYFAGGYDYRGKSIVKELYSTYPVGGRDEYINMPELYKNWYPALTTEISYTPNRNFIPERTNKSTAKITASSGAFTAQKQCYIDIVKNDSLEQEFVGYNIYFEDGMNENIYQKIRLSLPNSKCYSGYLAVDKNGDLAGTLSSVSYDACKRANDNTVCFFSDFPTFSEDYNSYDSFFVCHDFDFN